MGFQLHFLTATEQNTPIRRCANSTLFVDRQPRRPKPTATPKAPSSYGTQEILLMYGAIAIGILCTMFFVPCLLPVLAFWRVAYRTEPTPPAARFWFGLTAITALVAVIVGGYGVLQWELFFAHNLHVVLPKWLTSTGVYTVLNATDAKILAVTLAPTYATAIIYSMLLGRSDRRAIAAVLDREKQAAADQQRAITRAMTKAERQRAATVTESQQIDRLLLGEVRARVWDSVSQTWRAVPAQLIDHATAAFLTPTNITRHMSIVAPTQSGKTTSLIMPMIHYCHRNRIPAIVFDPKGNDFKAHLFHVNFSTLPLRDLDPQTLITKRLRLCLLDPELDPQDGATKLAEAIIPANPLTPPYFTQTARGALAGIMIGYRLVHSVWPELFPILAYCEKVSPERDVLLDELSRIAGDTQRDLKERRSAEENKSRIARAAALSSEGNDALGSLITPLESIGTGKYRDILTTNAEYGITVSQIIKNKWVARFAIPTDSGETGRVIGRIVIGLYTDYVLSPRCPADYLKLIIIDEAHNYVCEALTRGLPQSAGRKAGYMIAVQNWHQFTDPNARRIVYNECRTKFAMGKIDPDDAELISRSLGETSVETISRSVNSGTTTGSSTGTSRSTSTGQSAGDSSAPNASSRSSSRSVSNGDSTSDSTSTNDSRSKGENVQYARRPFFTPSEIINMDRFHAVARIEGQPDGEPPLYIRFLNPQEAADAQARHPYRVRDVAAKQPAEYDADTPIPDHKPQPPVTAAAAAESAPPAENTAEVQQTQAVAAESAALAEATVQEIAATLPADQPFAAGLTYDADDTDTDARDL